MLEAFANSNARACMPADRIDMIDVCELRALDKPPNAYWSYPHFAQLHAGQTRAAQTHEHTRPQTECIGICERILDQLMHASSAR